MSTALHPQTAGALPALPPMAPTAPRQAAAAGSARWQTEQLFGPRSEVEIEHRGSIYRLRITSLGKLILTK